MSERVGGDDAQRHGGKFIAQVAQRLRILGCCQGIGSAAARPAHRSVARDARSY